MKSVLTSEHQCAVHQDKSLLPTAIDIIANSRTQDRVQRCHSESADVGDSGVAKSGLAGRLASNTFKPHSEHARRIFSHVVVSSDILGDSSRAGKEAELDLWDLGG